MTAKLTIAKDIIRKNFDSARYGIFFTPSIVGDVMFTLFESDGLRVGICYAYGYFEVYGLNKIEQAALEEYYSSLM